MEYRLLKFTKQKRQETMQQISYAKTDYGQEEIDAVVKCIR